MQARAVGQLHDRVARDRELRAQRVIGRVRVRHERVEAVVAAFELDQHEQVAVVRAAVGSGGEGAAAKPTRGGSAERAERGSGQRDAEKRAAVHGSGVRHLSWYAASSTIARTSVRESAS